MHIKCVFASLLFVFGRKMTVLCGFVLWERTFGDILKEKNEGVRKMKKFFDEFKKFAMRGNVVDMAIGVVMGAAFSKIVTSLVNDLIMPVLTLFTGGIDISNQFISLNGVAYETLAKAQEAGAATFNYGVFLQTIIDFLLVALSLFTVICVMNKLHLKKQESAPAPAPAPTCPMCLEDVKPGAKKCGHCGSDLK